jgi:hypothetical protein
MAMVVAFAGRRVDPPNAEQPRFPAANVAAVRERIHAALAGFGADVLVSSAACGADLLALDAAGDLGIRRVIVMPWSAARFRDASVVDRGAEWGGLFDRIVGEVDSRDRRVLGRAEDDDGAYVATNEAILDAAIDVARESAAHDDVMAIVAWNGESRGSDDITKAFMTSARGRGLQVVEIPTI